MDEVLADARRRASSRSCDRRADVGRAPAVLEAVGDQLAQQPHASPAASSRARGLDEVVERAASSGSPSPGSRNSPPAARVGAGLQRLPRRRRAASAGSAVTTRARTSIDRWSCGLGDAELDDLGAEVVEVALQARLGVDADVEVVDALGRRGRRPHAQRVEVVGDRPVVAVLGQVADARSSSRRRPARRAARAGEVALGDVARRPRPAPPGPRSSVACSVAAVGLRAAAELEVGAQALQAQHRLGVARVARRRGRARRARRRPRPRPSRGRRARRAGSARPGSALGGAGTARR